MPTARDATPPPGAEGRRKLPIGIQTFSEIRTGGYYYVDKTAGLRRLIDAGKHFFLSRPRRFGKSLLVDTLKQLFEGNRPLFEGLAIHDHWDWTVRHPVLQLDFSGGDFTAPDALPAHVADQMAAAERRAGLAGAYASIPGRFAGLIEALHQKSGQRVVVLVDEYDKPILDALETPDAARANRNFLRGLYGTIKSSDAHVRFTLLTLGLDVRVEDSTSRGRLHLAVAFNDQMYLFEFKVVERAAAGAALAQLRDKRYAEKYRGLGAPIHLIGVESAKRRGV